MPSRRSALASSAAPLVLARAAATQVFGQVVLGETVDPKLAVPVVSQVMRVK